MVAGLTGGGFLAAVVDFAVPGVVLWAVDPVVDAVVFGLVAADGGFVAGGSWASNTVDNRRSIPRICSG